MQLVEQRSLNLSIILHGVAILVLFVGLPAILPSHPDPTPTVMTVEILPITGVTNVKPSDQPIQKEQNAPAPKVPPKQPDASAAPPMKAPAPKPVEKEKHFDPTEGAEPAPDAKKEEKKKDEPKKDEKSEFDKIMADLKKNAPAPDKPMTPAKPTPTPTATPGKDATTTPKNDTKSDAPYDASLPLSLSETDAIKGQIIPNWNPPIGAKDSNTLVVRVKVELLQDGTVKSAEIASDQKSRYASDGAFRAAADAALRAVNKTHQIKNLPPEKFGTWKEIEMTFDPKDLL